MSHSDNISYLKNLAKSLSEDLHNLVVSEFLENQKFLTCTGSLDNKHHYGCGGLLQHTREVVELCFSTKNTLNLDIDGIELYLSAIFHDVGKILDYEPIDESFSEWRGTLHKRMIHHISGSASIWTRVCRDNEKFHKYHDAVLHSILSHHGQREWGSPVAPYTKVAWLVHLCDGISARMNDCDKIDYLKIRNNE